MHKRILAITLCLVMVSAFAATSAVSAKHAGQSDIRQYDVPSPSTGILVGKLTINVATGHWVINGNPARANHEVKVLDKGVVGEIVAVFLQNEKANPKTVPIGTSVVNAGGNIHTEGMITDDDTLNWIAYWGIGASASVHPLSTGTGLTYKLVWYYTGGVDDNGQFIFVEGYSTTEAGAPVHVQGLVSIYYMQGGVEQLLGTVHTVPSSSSPYDFTASFTTPANFQPDPNTKLKAVMQPDDGSASYEALGIT